VNTLDLLLLLAAVAAAAGGWRVGFTARALSWGGMAIGLYAASRLLPTIVRWQRNQDESVLLVLIFGALLLGAAIGQVAGFLLGARLRAEIPRGGPEAIDRTGGAAAGVIGVLAAFWLLLPTMANTPGWPAQQARGSLLAEALHDHLPEPPDAVVALRRLVGEDVFPQVLEGLGAAPDLGAPPAASGLDKATQDGVAASTVQVEAAACDRVQDGSGVVVGDDEVVTNAHVVAGSSHTLVRRHPDNAPLDADVIAFDPDRDVAILHVGGLDRPPLPVSPDDPPIGSTGAVFGHPRGGPLAVQPYQVGQIVNATGRDIYDGKATRRRVLFLASSLAPGDSGGALVDREGTVVGIAFAIAPDRNNVAYALATSEVEAVLATVGAGAGAVPTGACLG
jgi:S1-C subfamily serine protease